MSDPTNDAIAGRLDEVARLLEAQGADRFRVAAYRRAATRLRGLPDPVDRILRERGLPGLEALPDVGIGIARAIQDILVLGRLPMLDRLRGEADPVSLLASVPGIGRRLADRLHADLGLASLEELEAAARDGRLEYLAGFGHKRLAGIRDSLAHRLGRVRPPSRAGADPGVAELLDVDREYREGAAAGTLPRLAPRRFNPAGEAWLPVLHTRRGPRRYTALFSNTARAHRLGRTRDWVVLFHEGPDGWRQHTVVTATRGPLRGRRIVAGREAESAACYTRPAA